MALTNIYDAVIIGSGFGGGVTTLRLTQAGLKVCVLERGKRWRGKNMPKEFAHQQSKPFPTLGDKDFFWGKQLWQPWRQRLGLYQIHQMPGLQTIMASGVGGGSLVWDLVTEEAPDEVFTGWSKHITPAIMKENYALADQYFQRNISPGIPGNPDKFGRTVRRGYLYKQAAEAVGQPWEPVHLSINFGDPAQVMANGFGAARQRGCSFCGICPAGCPQNAKNSVDVTYIAAAEALGAEIRPLHQVSAIKHLENGNYLVSFNRYDDDGRLIEKSSLEAKRVVVSAGTMGTMKLLLTAKRKGHLPKLSKALGTRFSFNGNVLDGALKRGTPVDQIEVNDGPAIVSMIKYDKFIIEDHAGPTWSAGMVGTSTPERGIAFAKALSGLKGTPEEVAKKAKDLLVFVGVGQDRSHGRLALNALGMLSLNWPGGINNEPVVKAQHEAMKELSKVMGREHQPNVLSLFDRPLTYHPLGGAPISDSPDDGVVDSFGRVYGYPGLYIADGSIIPNAIGRNPSFTIAALAERVSQGIVSDLG